MPKPSTLITSAAMLRFLCLVLFCALPITAAAEAKRTLLVFGDSLSAGFGIAVNQSWPALLQRKLDVEQRPYAVANASISGETTAGGRSRFDAAMKEFKPAVVIIELGANDGLRGLPVAAMEDNLNAMIRVAQTAHAKVLLVGMRLPPNYGPDYTAAFEGAFAHIARQRRTALLPFLLAPIVGDPASFQNDGLHPIAEAQPRLMEHVWKSLAPLL
ncbi:MAG TPA: arylesterase [Rhodocyclaceae bacterium]